SGWVGADGRGGAGCGATSRPSVLLEAVLNVAERVVQLGADALHDGNDGNRNTGGNQAVFNGRGTRLVSHKTLQHRHSTSPCFLASSPAIDAPPVVTGRSEEQVSRIVQFFSSTRILLRQTKRLRRSRSLLLPIGCARRLLQAVLHAAERGIQLRTDVLHDGNNGDGDAGGDQAIFNGGRARLVTREALNEGLHHWLLDPRG